MQAAFRRKTGDSFHDYSSSGLRAYFLPRHVDCSLPSAFEERPKKGSLNGVRNAWLPLAHARSYISIILLRSFSCERERVDWRTPRGVHNFDILREDLIDFAPRWFPRNGSFGCVARAALAVVKEKKLLRRRCCSACGCGPKAKPGRFTGRR